MNEGLCLGALGLTQSHSWCSRKTPTREKIASWWSQSFRDLLFTLWQNYEWEKIIQSQICMRRFLQDFVLEVGNCSYVYFWDFPSKRSEVFVLKFLSGKFLQEPHLKGVVTEQKKLRNTTGAETLRHGWNYTRLLHPHSIATPYLGTINYLQDCWPF